jgi:hypothetical protein
MHVWSGDPASTAPELLPLLPLPLPLPELPLLPLLPPLLLLPPLPPLLPLSPAHARDASCCCALQLTHPAQVKVCEPTVYEREEQAPWALIVVQTFMVVPPVQPAPLVQVVFPLVLLDPLLEPLELPLLLDELDELPELEPPPVPPLPLPDPRGSVAPEQAMSAPRTPIQATIPESGANRMPPPTSAPGRTSPTCGDVDAIEQRALLFRSEPGRDLGILEARR